MINTPSRLRSMIANAEAANVPSNRVDALREELHKAEEGEASFSFKESFKQVMLTSSCVTNEYYH